MKSRQITFVDGKATREEIEKITGTKKGLVRLCKSKGLPQATLSRICINGYGDPKIIERYIEAGIPIVRSNRPIPSRTNKEYTRAYRKEKDPQPTELIPAGTTVEVLPILKIETSDGITKYPTLENFTPKQEPAPKQLTIEDLTQAEQVKELLITHFTALIEDLKKI